MRYGTNKEKNTKLGEGLRWLIKESHGIRKKKKSSSNRRSRISSTAICSLEESACACHGTGCEFNSWVVFNIFYLTYTESNPFRVFKYGLKQNWRKILWRTYYNLHTRNPEYQKDLIVIHNPRTDKRSRKQLTIILGRESETGHPTSDHLFNLFPLHRV